LEHLYQIYKKHPVVCTDSREITTGCLFFALKGDRFDGNTFALQALEKGAAYAVVDNPALPDKASLIKVPDVLTALQRLATMHRRTLPVPVVAITGTNGKTTTKELVAQVLAARYRITVTQGNLNNHIGVPLTLLRMHAGTQIAVVEMGANHPGEIAALCRIAEPTHGLITNIGKGHLEGFGSLEGVQQTKGELYDYLSLHHGCVFYMADNPLLAAMIAARKFQETIAYGFTTDDAQVVKSEVHHPFLRLSVKGYPAIDTHLIGAYNADNVLAALSVGCYFGVRREEAVAAINSYVPSNNRSQLIRSENNTVIMDAYNANPSSMTAAIENFARMEADNKWLILGDMLELGAESDREHRAVVALLLQEKLTRVLLVGEAFTQAAQHTFPCFASTAALQQYLAAHPVRQATVLVKGSHGIGLDKLKGDL
jgi:UDP-N-acetylmuramoyl-tripeptide--D-alanyl-D-alanine ligase